MPILRGARTLLVALASLSLGCADFKAMAALDKEVQAEFHVAPQINISNGTDLTITFPESSIEQMKLDSTGVDAFARRVAVFAMSHYSGPTELRHISVSSRDVNQVGPLTVTRVPMSRTFSAAELSNP